MGLESMLHAIFKFETNAMHKNNTKQRSRSKDDDDHCLEGGEGEGYQKLVQDREGGCIGCDPLPKHSTPDQRLGV